MNKYYAMLDNVLKNGREQRNKKGNIRYLTNEVMRMDAGDLLDIFESHGIARKKLRSELELFCRGERNTEAYREAGISWWDYCGPILVNSYPTYFEKLPRLIERINREKRNSKNYVLFLGETNAENLSTDCGTYRSDNYWKLSDYLDVLKCLVGTKFVYFSSSKSTIVELADWMGRNQSIGNPFEGAKIYRHHVSGIALNYDDMMLVKAA